MIVLIQTFSKKLKVMGLVIIGLLLASQILMAASDKALVVEIKPPADGSITKEKGLEAWERVYKVASHPRCANCHVGENNVPMWSGPSYGKARPHGMNINAGKSRIGAETLPCMSCHTTSKDIKTGLHMAPRFGIAWQLAPVEFEWFGKSSKEICDQLKDPARNGNREGYIEIAEHLQHDAGLNGPVLWGWNPGGDREPAPFTLQDHVNDVLEWGVAGMPCPGDDKVVSQKVVK